MERPLSLVSSYDPLLKTYADGASALVISIGYRLAPEDPFPAGPDDCRDAADWLADNAEKELGAPLRYITGDVRLTQALS